MRIGIVLFASAVPLGLASAQETGVTHLRSEQVEAAFAQGRR